MYDAAANTLSWIATILGIVTLLRTLFTYDRTYTLPGVAIVFAIVVFLVVRMVIESMLTSQQMARKAKERCLLGGALAAAAILLIATHDPSKNPNAVNPEQAAVSRITDAV